MGDKGDDKKLRELFPDGRVTLEEMTELCDIASQNLRANYTELDKAL